MFSARRLRHLVPLLLMIIVLAMLWADPASAAQSDDGSIIKTVPCEAKQLTYDGWLRTQETDYAAEVKSASTHGTKLPPFAEQRAALQTPEEFERRRAYEGFKCQRLNYVSDGLKVIAYVWRPENVEGKRLPLIIFNRGGGQDFGGLDPWERDGFYDYLKSGFVVIGTQYRGNDGGEGHDEEGGADIHDVLNLFPLAKSLGYADMDNVFMMGDSRGAMMTYLAMRNGAKVNAAAVVGSETDLIANLKRRPELREGYKKDTPGFAADPDKALRQRSALFWPEAISAPLLMMHGGKDWRVPPTQDLTFAAKLEALGKPYQLSVFEGGVHLLTFHWRERDSQTIGWFKRHMIGARSNTAQQ